MMLRPMRTESGVRRHHGEVTTFRITGMTCAACERRVVKALSALPGVESVRASAVRGRAVLTGTPPSQDAVRAALERTGYSLGAPPWFSRDRRAWGVAGISVVVIIGVAWLAARSQLLEATASAAAADSVAAGLLLALLVGLAAGVSTCMALVGGLVLSVSASRAEGTTSAPADGGDLRPHLIFTAGRLVGFAVGGALLGVIGSAARLPGPVVALITLTAAAFMALLGVRLTGLSPRLSGWALTLPGRWNERFGLGRNRGLLAAGAATFLLPCGFTQAMQLYAISVGDPVVASAVMVAFALGTTPGLLGLGALGSLSGRGDRSGTALRVVGVLVLAFAVVSGTGGLRSLGMPLPSLPASGAPQLATGTVSPNVRLDGDVQVVTMTQNGHGYSPAHTTVWAGIPIRWTIDVTAKFSCSAFLRVPSVGIKADFTTEGQQIVDVPALQVGTTKFACVMGMYGGSFRAIPRP